MVPPHSNSNSSSIHLPSKHVVNSLEGDNLSSLFQQLAWAQETLRSTIVADKDNIFIGIHYSLDRI